MAVKIKATFTKDTKEYDGLGAISEELAKDPLKRRVVIAVVELTNTDVDHLNGGVRTPKVRFASIEAMSGDDEIAARKLLDAAYHERTGQTAPPPSLFDDGVPGNDAAGNDGEGKGGPPWPGDEDYVPPPVSDAAQAEDEVAAKRGRKK